MALTGTIAAVSVLSGGLWALCATVFATATWTAPACLAAGFTSGVGLILGIVHDATAGNTKQNGNDPDKRVGDDLPTTYHKLHPDGHYEDYTWKLHELYGTNETHIIVDMDEGYTHTVSSTPSGHAKVHTDFTSNMGRSSTRGLKGRESKAKNELQEAYYYAQKVGPLTAQPSKANAKSLGRTIANKAWKLGTWCVSMQHGDIIVGDIGLTLGGGGYEPTHDEAPCMSQKS
jgi:hypothetical protein